MALWNKDTMAEINSDQDFINTGITSNGYDLPPALSADGNGLPYSKVTPDKSAKLMRNIITWFVPEFGTVRMFVNPESISYQHAKLINKERTKGGFSLQYWGEDIIVINIGGTTGSSGIEGINMLYEIYRAEQYAGDAIGLTLAANNSNYNAAANLVTDAFDSMGNNGIAGTIVGGLLGVDSPAATSFKDINTLAQLAFSVEMYYNGWVYRGYFSNMTIDESASNFLLSYKMTFNAVQKRGYRTNYFPWSKSANSGPSRDNSPSSFSPFVAK